MKLYIVPTPIGNLEDFTFRAVKVLQESDAIFCEDTRVTIKLLNSYEIKTKLHSLHEHNEMSRLEMIKNYLDEEKQIVLVSDAGTPCISDPGTKIINQLLKEGYEVTALPGATAFTTALSASGFDTSKFSFYGFFERKQQKAVKQLKTLIGNDQLSVFYESPHRINKTLQLIYETLGDVKVCLGRELTKYYEQYYRGNISQFLETQFKGELVLILDKVPALEKNIVEEVQNLYERGYSQKDIIKMLKDEFNKNDIYREYLKIKNN